MNTSGDSYKRIAEAFKKLNENTALYLRVERPDGTQGLRMTQLFSWIDFYADGLVKFKFSEDSTPYVLDLKEKFYSFKLGELSRINGKYALIMLKMWESYRRGKEAQTTISAPLEDWQSWFLEKYKRIPAGRFYADVLTRADLSLKIGTDMVEKKGFKRYSAYSSFMKNASQALEQKANSEGVKTNEDLASDSAVKLPDEIKAKAHQFEERLIKWTEDN